MVEINREHLRRIYKYSLDELKVLESKCFLSKFDGSIAFDLGCKVRQWAIEAFPEKSLVIDVSLPSGQCLFHATTASGTCLDNDIWIQRKKKTAFRFGCSSFFMGQKLRQKNAKSMEEAFYIDSKEYAVHGGAAPIILENSDTIVACLTVSGLKQEEDHLFAITCVIEYANRLLESELNLD